MESDDDDDDDFVDVVDETYLVDVLARKDVGWKASEDPAMDIRNVVINVGEESFIFIYTIYLYVYYM